MNDRIDAVLVDTSVYHKKQCDFEGITNSIIPMLLQLLRANNIKLLVLFTANYETGLTAIRAVTVNRTLTIIDQVNWSCYIDLNSMAVVETVEEGNNNYDTPDMGIKLTKKAELRKKKVAELKKFDERAEG